MSPIERLIDSNMHCLRCGKTGGIGSCGCWVECRGYESEKGNSQIAGFGSMTLRGIPINNDVSYTFISLLSNKESASWHSGMRSGMVLITHCISCGWWPAPMSTNGFGEEHFLESYCMSCIAPISSPAWHKWDGTEQIDKALIVTVRDGKILLNGLGSEYWDGLLLGHSDPYEAI